MEYLKDIIVGFPLNPFFPVFTSLLIGVTSSGLTLWITGYRGRAQEVRRQEIALKMIVLEVRLNVGEIEEFKTELESYIRNQEEKQKQNTRSTGWSRQIGIMRRHANLQEASEIQEAIDIDNAVDEGDIPKTNELKNFRETIAGKYPSFQDKAYAWGIPILYGILQDEHLLNLFRFYALISNIVELPVRVTSNYVKISQVSTVDVSSYDPLYEEEIALIKDYLILLERALKIGKILISALSD